ncbi:MAG: tetratricopeptide repeat protein [Blastocatellia bacterium]
MTLPISLLLVLLAPPYFVQATSSQRSPFPGSVKSAEVESELEGLTGKGAYDLGLRYYKDRKYAEAVQAFEASTKLDSNNPDPYYALGLSYLVLYQTRSAQASFRKAIQLAPDWIEPHLRLGWLMTQDPSAEEDAALHFAQHLVSQWPRSAEGHCLLGMAYFQKDKNEEAVSEYSKAIEINPGYADAYSKLGWLYSNWRKYDLAVKIVEEGF